MKNLKTNYVFERVEKKYLLSKEKYSEFLKRVNNYIKADNYGLTSICNIYYDTENYDLVRRSIDKPNYKEKLRLRSYGVPNGEDTVFLEIKKKCNGVVFKRRISMSENEAEDYFENGNKPKCYSQILNEIDYFIKYYRPTPKIFLAYDRVAYYGIEDSELRITFDENIRSRDYDLDLKSGDYGEKLLQAGEHLMEIKTASAMPIWLTRTLSYMNIYPLSFSKYGEIYANKLKEAIS